MTNTVLAKRFLARINGAGASFGCLARSIGPLVAGKMFDLGMKIHYIIVPFWILAAVATCGAVESALLSDHP